MPFNLGFQTKHILNPLSMHFNPVKVLLMGFAILFKIHSRPLSALCTVFRTYQRLTHICNRVYYFHITPLAREQVFFICGAPVDSYQIWLCLIMKSQWLLKANETISKKHSSHSALWSMNSISFQNLYMLLT